ncbi:hypothetical protein ROZALSC1DRAFT_23703 [Rozella allomycis CSF55]|uniref:Amine oxidase domain-containing protein n=1 Tax=Rozella allomycis (strain CSF55) TaxID=988480 RepID=A0A4P9YEW3_ROZAC|nr:hypothetical protein ROZALSC1DRAFT_23703 [Rozella allomycis CSF55]
MNSVAKHLQHEILTLNKTELFLNSKVLKIVPNEICWRVMMNDSSIIEGKYLVLTCPVPQSLAIIEEVISEQEKEELSKVEYQSTIALLLAFPNTNSSIIPRPGGIRITCQKSPIYWIASQKCKDLITDGDGLVIHMKENWSNEHYGMSDEWIIENIKEALKSNLEKIGITIPNECIHSLKRWRYATPKTTATESFLSFYDGTLFLAGDAFNASKVEGAFLSGLDAANTIINKLHIG